MTDKQFVLAVLADGKPRSTMEILQASIAERGCGLTVHSRVADLRGEGHAIACWNAGQKNGRPVYEYQLLEGPLRARNPQVANGAHAAGARGLDSSDGGSVSALSESRSPGMAESGLAAGPALPLFDAPEFTKQRTPDWA